MLPPLCKSQHPFCLLLLYRYQRRVRKNTAVLLVLVAWWELPSPLLEFGHRLAIVSWNAQLRGTYKHGALNLCPSISIGCCRRCCLLPSHASHHSFPKARHHGNMFSFMSPPCSSPQRGRSLQKCTPRRNRGILPNRSRREGCRQKPEPSNQPTLALDQEQERHQRELHGCSCTGVVFSGGSQIRNIEHALCKTA